MLSWQLGLKACALYRDGSKLSQRWHQIRQEKERNRRQAPNPPLPTQLQQPCWRIADRGHEQAHRQELLEEVQKRVQASPDTIETGACHMSSAGPCLPKRRGFTQKAKINGQTPFCVRESIATVR